MCALGWEICGHSNFAWRFDTHDNPDTASLEAVGRRTSEGIKLTNQGPSHLWGYSVRLTGAGPLPILFGTILLILF